MRGEFCEGFRRAAAISETVTPSRRQRVGTSWYTRISISGHLNQQTTTNRGDVHISSKITRQFHYVYEKVREVARMPGYSFSLCSRRRFQEAQRRLDTMPLTGVSEI